MVGRVFFYIIMVIVFCNAAPLQYLSRMTAPETAFDTVSTNFIADYSTYGVNDDAVDRNVPIGFSFFFNGSQYTTVNIDSNGILYFGNYNLTEYFNRTLPRNNRPQSIYPYWDDLNMDAGGSITYGTLGTAPNRRFVVSWNNVPHYPSSGAYTFQVVLYENGNIRFRYDATSSTNGTSATIGVQENTNNYDQYSYNAAIDPTQDIIYYRPVNMSIAKTSCVINDSVNGSTNPKRIPGATVRYAIQVSNSAEGSAENVIVDDTLNSNFDYTTIRNLQIQNGACNCLGVTSANNNPPPGTGNGVHPIKLNFGTVAGGTVGNPTQECGYFEVDIK